MDSSCVAEITIEASSCVWFQALTAAGNMSSCSYRHALPRGHVFHECQIGRVGMCWGWNSWPSAASVVLLHAYWDCCTNALVPGLPCCLSWPLYCRHGQWASMALAGLLVCMPCMYGFCVGLLYTSFLWDVFKLLLL